MDKQKFYAEEKGEGIARSSGKVSCRESPRLCIFMASTYRAKWKMRGRGNDIDREPYRERGIRETCANRSLQRERERTSFSKITANYLKYMRENIQFLFDRIGKSLSEAVSSNIEKWHFPPGWRLPRRVTLRVIRASIEETSRADCTRWSILFS